MSFGEAVRLLLEAGFDGYAVDFRRATRSYYMPDGATAELPTASIGPVAEHFDSPAIAAAVHQAQTGTPGYTYHGFCRAVTRAGCAGYLVSLLGRRVLYFGRTGETHTEYFPAADR
jgi:uncharacterized protein YbcV (DUF1398 family)